jgi:hypothetical protein
MKSQKGPTDNEIEIVFLPPDGGWKMPKVFKREFRRLKSYEAPRNGVGWFNWEDGEVWEFKPDKVMTGRRINEVCPKRIEVGQHDPEGKCKNISLDLQYDHENQSKIGTYKADLITIGPNGQMVEHHLCTMDKYAPPAGPDTPRAATARKNGRGGGRNPPDAGQTRRAIARVKELVAEQKKNFGRIGINVKQACQATVNEYKLPYKWENLQKKYRKACCKKRQ